MPDRMEPLRQEHRTLLPHIYDLRTTADVVGTVGGDELRRLVDDSLGFLTRHLIPHATAEDHALYPVVERVMGAPGATATMSREHVEVDHLTHELGELRTRLEEYHTGDVDQELRRILYGLYALVSVHFAKEEEIYLPLLDDRLSDTETADLFASMHAEVH